jgi:hypothetical protein
MDQNTRLVRREELLEADVNGEIVALHIERGQCYGLNAVASEIWRMLEKPKSVGEICTALRDDYEIDESTCHQEVVDLLSDLKEEGLIEEVAR